MFGGIPASRAVRLRRIFPSLFSANTTMSSLAELQKIKAELDLKIAQSLETAKKITVELEQAQVRQTQIDRGTAEIQAVMDKYDMRLEDLIPKVTPKFNTAPASKEAKTLAEMREYFNRR